VLGSAEAHRWQPIRRSTRDSPWGISHQGSSNIHIYDLGIRIGPQTVTSPGGQNVLDSLQRTSGERNRSFVLRGGYVLSMDPSIGNFVGNVVMQADTITAVGPNATAGADATQIDVTGSIVMPGFVDSHLHAWEGQLRSLAPDLSLDDYTVLVHHRLAPHYRADDMQVGNFVTALQCLNAGITCLIDNSHNSRSVDHSNAAVEGLQRAGIRAVHASGAPVAGDWDQQWPEDLHRLRSEYFQSDNQLLTLRMFAASPDTDVWTFASQNELWISTEMNGGLWRDGLPGFLNDHHTFNHCSGMPPEAWEVIRDVGVTVNMASRSDTTFGIGPTSLPVDQALDYGIRPGLSMDNEICYAIDMFSEMRLLLHMQRAAAQRRLAAGEDGPLPVSVHDVLEFATIGGAVNAGLDHRIGSLTPGKAADVIVVGTEGVSTAPLASVVSAAVSFVNPSNVEAVFVAGEVRKWSGTLIGHDLRGIRGMAEASRDRLLKASGLTLDRFSSGPLYGRYS
jgi:5-methylthioadenosine/S-adenosylhomocysteine deaminase